MKNIFAIPQREYIWFADTKKKDVKETVCWRRNYYFTFFNLRALIALLCTNPKCLLQRQKFN